MPELVPDVDHLMRFVPYTQQLRDADTDEFVGILRTAFMLREGDNGSPSVTWIEHYGAKNTTTIKIAASAFEGSLRSKKLPRKSYFSIGSAGSVRENTLKFGKRIRLVHAPDGTNTGHVEIRRFDETESLLLEMLATEVFIEHISVVSIFP